MQTEKIYEVPVEVSKPRKIWKEMTEAGILKENKEIFVIFLLNTKNRIIKREIVSMGTLNKTVIHPRDVLRPAIECSANSFILAHNHPSGDSNPSQNDIKAHQAIEEAARIMGIKFLDDLVVCNSTYSSMTIPSMTEQPVVDPTDLDNNKPITEEEFKRTLKQIDKQITE